MRKTTRHIVTDHAVLRYLERVYGVDVEGLRDRIALVTAAARSETADAVNADGVKYRLGKDGRVITVTGVNGAVSKRAQRWIRRRT